MVLETKVRIRRYLYSGSRLLGKTDLKKLSVTSKNMATASCRVTAILLYLRHKGGRKMCKDKKNAWR